MDTIRQQIVNEITAILKTITKANGYASDIGNKVESWYATSVEENDLPVIVVRDLKDIVTNEFNQHHHELTIEVTVICGGKPEDVHPNLRIYEADLYKCFGQYDEQDGAKYDFTITGEETMYESENRYLGSKALTCTTLYVTDPYNLYETVM